MLLNNFLSGIIVEKIGWQYPFYIYGSLASVWGMIWLWYFDDTPEKSNRVTDEEKDYIQATTVQYPDRPKLSETPFCAIFTNRAFLALLIAGVTGTIQMYVIADYMPKYLKARSHFSFIGNFCRKVIFDRFERRS